MGVGEGLEMKGWFMRELRDEEIVMFRRSEGYGVMWNVGNREEKLIECRFEVR